MIDPQTLRTLEQQNGLPAGLLSAVMHQESGGNPNAVSPKGAQGLFQFMPETAKAYGIDPTDPMQAASGAAKMYGDLSKQYNGDLPSMLAAYNWGSGNLAKNGIQNAPVETQNYIKSITSALPQYAEAAPTVMTDAVVDNTPEPPNGFDLTEPPKAMPSPPEGFNFEAPPEKTLLEKTGGIIKDAVAEIPRQAGLTGRYVAEGISGLADIPNMVVNAVGEPLGMKPLGYPSQMVGTALDKMGVPQPQGTMQRVVGDMSRALAGTAGGIGLAKMTPALASLADNAAMQAKAALGSSSASSLTKEAGGGPLAQLGAGLLGGTIATRINIPKKEIYTADDVKKLSGMAYKKADELGGAIRPEAITKFADDIEQTILPDRAAKVFSGDGPAKQAVDKIRSLAGQRVTLSEAQSIDEQLGKMAYSYTNPNGTLRPEGRDVLQVQNAFRDMIENAGTTELIGGKDGFTAWKNAQKLWSKSLKLSDVERIVERADISDNPATTIRSGFKTMLNNPKRMRGFSEEEKLAIKQAAKTGVVDEVLRMAGSRVPALIGAGTGNPAAALGASAVGMGAREGGALLQLQRANKVSETIYGSKPRDLQPIIKAGALGTFYGSKQNNK